jgi:hypothetical protein
VDANNLVTQWNSAPAAEFTLTPTVSNFQVTQGSPINVTVNVAVAGGTLATPITFACTDTAPASTCTVPPSTSTSGQVSFAITTTAATAELRRPSDRGSRIFYAALLPGLLGIMLIGGSRRRSLRGMRFLGLIVALGFSTLWLASCGGSSSSGNPGNQGTPKGTYTVSVTGTSGTSTATTSFTIVVQ